MKEIPNYYAIIPAEVRYSDCLSANEKLLYGEITSLCNKTGECFARNEYFAELYNVDKLTVSRWISHLAKNGFLTIEIEYGANKQIVNRYIQINQYPIDKKINTPIDKKINDNNTSNNNTSNNKERKKEHTSTYDDILNDGIFDSELKTVFYEFIKMRKLIKKPLTDYALKRLISKLAKMGDTSTQIAILQKSIDNCWQGVYPLGKESQEKESQDNFMQHSFSKQELDNLYDEID